MHGPWLKIFWNGHWRKAGADKQLKYNGEIARMVSRIRPTLNGKGQRKS